MYICNVKQIEYLKIMNEQQNVKDNGSSNTLVTRHNQHPGFAFVNLLDKEQYAAAELFIQKIMVSDKNAIKSVADGMSMLARAQDLQLPFNTCLEHIHVINGKTGIDVHIIKSLLLRAGVVWECTKDYTPQYQYTDGNTIYLETQLPDYCVKCRTAKEAEDVTKDNIVGVYPVQWFTDLKGNVYNEFGISDKCVKAINKQHALKLAKEGNFPVIRIPAQPIDYVTEYSFTRYKLINGVERIMKCTSHFSQSEAITAGLTEKDTYKKYARILVGHRAFTLGARDIGDDLLMGCMEITELKIANGLDIDNSDIIDADYTSVE